MPYIKPEQRPPIDRVVEAAIAEALPSYTVGEMNYLITRLILTWLHPVGAGYARYSAARGVLQDVSDELYRRWMGPYEDKKLEENGDVT